MILIVVLACIPVFLLSFVINYVNHQQNTRQITRSIQDTMQSSFTLLSNQVQTALDTCGGLVNNSALSSVMFSTEYNYEVVQQIQSVRDSLSIIKENNIIIDNIVIHLPKLRLTISAAATETFTEEGYNRLADMLSEERYKIHVVDGRPSLFVAYPTTELTEQGMFIQIQLSVDYIRQSLKKVYAENVTTDAVRMDDLIILREPDPVVEEAVRAAGRAGGLAEFTVTKKQYELYALASDHLTYYVYVDLSALNSQQSDYIYILVLLLLLTVVTVFVSSYSLRRLIAEPVNKLLNAFSRMGRGDLNFALEADSRTDEFNHLFHGFNRNLVDMQNLIDEKVENRQRLENAEIKQLIYQIEPHFLYNTLHIIYFMAKNREYESIQHIVDHLSRYYKYLTGINRREITLAEEYEQIGSYLQIQHMRFSERIKGEIAPLDEKYRGIKMPHLTLQPVVENIFTHGLKNKQDGGFFRISFSEQDVALLVTVEDNGDESTDDTLVSLQNNLTKRDAVSSVALINVHRRIQLTMGEEYGLTFSRSDLGGLKVTIRLPIDRDRQDGGQ